MTKKTIAVLFCTFILICLLPVLTLADASNTYNNYDFATIPSSWIINTANEYARVVPKVFEDGVTNTLAFLCATTQRQLASAEAVTETLTVGNKFSISMKMAVNYAPVGARKKLRILSGENVIELFSIEQNQIQIVDSQTPVPELAFFDVELALDVAENTLVAWVDGNVVFEGTLPTVPLGTNGLRLSLYNGFTPRIATSDWYVAQLEVLTHGSFNLKSSPSNGAVFISVSDLNEIILDFGVRMSGGFADKQSIVLQSRIEGQDEFIDIPCGFTRQKSSITIVPSQPILENTQYRIAFSGLTDVFNNSYQVEPIYFSTAPGGYENMRVAIVSPGEGTSHMGGVPLSVGMNVIPGSGAFEKAELWVNGVLMDTVYDSGCSFTYYPQNAEQQIALQVLAYDSYGAVVKSAPVTVTITENKAPIIQFINIADGTSISAGAQIELSVDDEDGIITKTQVLLGGIKIYESQGAVSSFDIPQTSRLGQQILSVTAWDEYGTSGRKEISVWITKQDSDLLFSADIASYQGGNLNGMFLNTNATDVQRHYITNSQISERGNSLILGSENKTSGASCYAGWENGSSLRDNSSFVFEGDIYLETNHSRSNLILRSNTSPVVFVEDVRFINGELQYYDSSTIHTKALQIKKWYDFRFEVNLGTNTYNFYLDGEKLAENFHFRGDLVGKITSVRMDISNQADAPAFVAVSKFKIYKIMEYPYFDSASAYLDNHLLEGEQELEANRLFFGQRADLDPSQLVIKAVTLTGDGRKADLEKWEMTEDLKGIWVYPRYPLEAGYEYKLSVTFVYRKSSYNAEYIYTAPVAGDFNVQSGSFVVLGNQIRFEAEVSGKLPQSKELVLILASYKNGVIQDYQLVRKAVSQPGEKVLTPPVLFEENFVYEAVAAENIMRLKPLNNKIYSFSSNVNQAGGF